MKAMPNKFQRLKGNKKVQDLHTLPEEKNEKRTSQKQTNKQTNSKQTTFTRNQRKCCTNTTLYVYKLSMRLLAL